MNYISIGDNSIFETLPIPQKAANVSKAARRATLSPADLNLMLRRNLDVVVVDLREMEDHERGHLPGAINVSSNQWHDSELLCNDALNVLYARSAVCKLTSRAAQMLAQRGFEVAELEGGFEAWKSSGFEVDAL